MKKVNAEGLDSTNNPWRDLSKMAFSSLLLAVVIALIGWIIFIIYQM